MDNLKIARELWEEFGDVIIDDNECIESSWRTFDAGTSRYDIWHWFEDFFEVSVAEDLMGYRVEQEASKYPNEKELALEDLRSMQDGYIEGDGYERHPLPEWFALEKAIKALEQDWIPTRERLPELNINIGTKKNPLMQSDPVYITIRPKDTIGQNVVCPIPCILSSNGNWYVDGDSLDGWINFDSYDSGIEDPFSSNIEVVAWRPVFEPYE